MIKRILETATQRQYKIIRFYEYEYFSVGYKNDESEWKDQTGIKYHFPNRYKNLLLPGTKVIYYKGRQRSSIYRDKRLTSEAHYFRIAAIDSVAVDSASTKNDFYATISDFTPFSKPVLAQDQNGFLETIPDNRVNNYWRDGVRQIHISSYKTIISLSDVEEDGYSTYNDLAADPNSFFESTLTEGGQKFRFTSYYERNPKLRQQAVLIHGYTCKGCGFNFENFYGEDGKGFIEIHHLKPISESGQTEVNPETDLIPLCSNCHSMIHRKKNRILSIDELRAIINLIN